MRIVNVCLAICLCFGVGSVSVFAKGRNITIYEKAQLNEGVLEPGSYRVEVTEGSAGQEIMIYKGKHLVVQAPVLSEKQGRRIERNSVRLSLVDGRNPQIIEIRFAGDSQVYKVQDVSTAAKQKAS